MGRLGAVSGQRREVDRQVDKVDECTDGKGPERKVGKRMVGEV